MDCRSVSEADWVCDWGEGVQCPKERKPIFFMQVKFTVWFGLRLGQYVRTYYYVAMGKPSVREELLDAGFKVMFRSGYTAASVRDICEAAQVPLGSFTNHFRSKEAFAQEVLDRYFAGTKSVVEEALEDKSLTPRQRLMRSQDLISGRIADRKWNLG